MPETPQGAAGAVPPATAQAAASAPGPLPFVDTGGFDRELSRLVASAQEQTVELGFFSPVTPNQIPERLQKWLGAVEKQGGSVTIQAPPGELSPKSPALIASLLGAAWNGIKMFNQLAEDRMYASVNGRDAVIVLDRDPATRVVTVKSLEFRPRTKAVPGAPRN